MTEHWAELPVLCSRFLYRAAYTSIPNRTQLVSGAVASTVSSPFFPFPFMMSLCRHARVAFLTAILWYFSMHRSIYMWKGKIAHLYFVVFINDMNFRGTRVIKNECYSHAITVNINRKSSKIKRCPFFPLCLQNYTGVDNSHGLRKADSFFFTFASSRELTPVLLREATCLDPKEKKTRWTCNYQQTRRKLIWLTFLEPFTNAW